MPNTPKLIRTELERQIRERNMTYEEFVEYVERFAREHNEPGTLSLRHLQRLASGSRSSTSVRPATARLLEEILRRPIEELLRTCATVPRDKLHVLMEEGSRADNAEVMSLREGLVELREKDRCGGATSSMLDVYLMESRTHKALKQGLPSSISKDIVPAYVELCTLAGWQHLDSGDYTASWKYYGRAIDVARSCQLRTHGTYARAERALILLDISKPADAIDLLNEVLLDADKSSLAWISAAVGEAYAFAGMDYECRTAFDRAMAETSSKCREEAFFAADVGTIDRWRSHALSILGSRDAVPALVDRLSDTSISARARCVIHVDLCTMHAKGGEMEQAIYHFDQASGVGAAIGSKRLTRRLSKLQRRYSHLSR